MFQQMSFACNCVPKEYEENRLWVTTSVKCSVKKISIKNDCIASINEDFG